MLVPLQGDDTRDAIPTDLAIEPMNWFIDSQNSVKAR